MSRYKKTKLTDEERVARIHVSKKAYEAKNSSLRREYHLAYAAAQRQVLLDAGFVPRPVGRPPRDPDNVIRKLVLKESGGTNIENISAATKGSLEPAGARRAGSPPRVAMCRRAMLRYFCSIARVVLYWTHPPRRVRQTKTDQKKCLVTINHTTYSN